MIQKYDHKPSPDGEPLQPIDVLIHPDGPFPPAPLWMRGLAYGMDLFLLTLISTFFIIRVLWPSEYPGAYEELAELIGASEEGSTLSPYLTEAMSYAQNVMLVIFTLYFALGELFFRGGTLGKSAFRLRTMSLITLDKLSPVSAITRALLKSLCFAFLPLLFINILCRFFNPKRRLLGHDLVSRSVVIIERPTSKAHPAPPPAD